MEELWRIELFGGLRAVRGRTVIDRFRTQKTAALLGYLALHKGRRCSREIVCELLWPDSEPEKARNSLSTALWSLRQQFRECEAESDTVLQADRESVLLCGQQVSTDVEELERAVALTEPTAEAVGAWRRALGLYRGELLPDLYEDWAVAAQEHYRHLYSDTFRRLIAHFDGAGDLRSAVDFARRAASAEPLSQPVSLMLMRLLVRAGDPAGALREFRRLQESLRSELGVAPGAEILDLARTLSLTAKASPERGESRGESPTAPLSESGLWSERTGAAGFTTCSRPLPELEPVGGAVPLHSPFYVTRPCDRDLFSALDRKELLVLLKGSGQMGKSSLLARGADWGRAAGSRVVLCDLQKLCPEQLATAETLFAALAQWMGVQLEVDTTVIRDRMELLGPSIGLEWFLRRYVLEAGPHLVWVLDEADRLFGVPHGVDLFRLFRSWHNERALDPSGPWTRLTVVIAYSTEAHLFIPDPNQSPFNVGCHVHLQDLTFADVERLNEAYGAPLRGKGEISRLIDLLGGHPHLVRASLDALARRKANIEWIEQQARTAEGVFNTHLAYLRGVVCGTPGLEQAVRDLAGGVPIPDEDRFLQLRSLGLVSGNSRRSAAFRCRLYLRHFKALVRERLG